LKLIYDALEAVRTYFGQLFLSYTITSDIGIFHYQCKNEFMEFYYVTYRDLSSFKIFEYRDFEKPIQTHDLPGFFSAAISIHGRARRNYIDHIVEGSTTYTIKHSHRFSRSDRSFSWSLKPLSFEQAHVLRQVLQARAYLPF
jgi:hypothetical protein